MKFHDEAFFLNDSNTRNNITETNRHAFNCAAGVLKNGLTAAKRISKHVLRVAFTAAVTGIESGVVVGGGFALVGLLTGSLAGAAAFGLSFGLPTAFFGAAMAVAYNGHVPDIYYIPGRKKTKKPAPAV